MLSRSYFQGQDGAPPGDHLLDPNTLKEASLLAVKPSRLIACVDETSTAQRVVAHAAEMAKNVGMELRIVRVVEDEPVGTSPVDPIEWKIRTQEHRRHLQELARDNGADPMKAGVLLHGDPPAELIDWSAANGGALLALSTQSGAHKFGLGPTALRILEHGTASLFLIPKTANETATCKRVLVPIDGSTRADSVIPFALRIARATGAELILAHVLSKPSRQAGFGPASAPHLHAQIEQEIAARAREHLEQLRIHCADDGLSVRSLVLGPADPRHATCEFATKNHVDLVVMSSHGATALNDVPCGSVAEYLASHCTMPVLMVRPNLVAGFQADNFGLDGQSVFRFG